LIRNFKIPEEELIKIKWELSKKGVQDIKNILLFIEELDYVW
jgi:hypothetical protein